MTAINPHVLWLLVVAPIVWWIAQRRATRGTAVVPHLPVLESILTARDTSPSTPPWRAVALAAGCALAVLAAADLRWTEPAPRRLLVLWGGDALAGEAARARVAEALPGDDVHLLQAGPAGLRADVSGVPPETDFRWPAMDAANAALQAAAGEGGLTLTQCGAFADDAHRPLAFRLVAGRDGVRATARWRGTATRTLTPVLVPADWRARWEPIWTGSPIAPGQPLELDALLAASPGMFEATAVLMDVVTEAPLDRTAVASVCFVPEPRAALLVTDGTPRAIERAVVAGLASMPDLISRAGRVRRADLRDALAGNPGALLIGLGVGPSAAPGHDWICLEPPAGDALLPVEAAGDGMFGVADRFNGAHPVSRGLAAAGIEIDALRRLKGSGPADRPDARYVPLLTTDGGVAAVAGSLPGEVRVVGVLGDASRAFAGFPAWPRFLRRSVAWIGEGRQARSLEIQRAGSDEVERPDGAAGWRGRTRGGVRLDAGVRRAAEGASLLIEPDPFQASPPPHRAADLAAMPARERRPSPGPPAPWAALLAACCLVAAVVHVPRRRPLPAGDASRA